MDLIKKPTHYNSHPSGIECRQVTRLLNGNRAAAFKYMFRRKLKGNEVQDFEKAINYIEDEFKYNIIQLQIDDKIVKYLIIITTILLIVFSIMDLFCEAA